MIRLSISVALAFAVAMSAEAMLPVPLHEPDAMITQVRQAHRWVTWPQAKCWDPNQVVINGHCEFYARHVSRAQHRCVAGNEGFCIEYYGTLAPCGPEVRC
jgi:hypothetical protein